MSSGVEYRGRARGVGTTTEQITKAPQGCVYLVHNHRIVRHTELLCHHLGRKDIRVESVQWVLDERHRGMDKPITADHAVWDTSRGVYQERLQMLLGYHNSKIEARIQNDKPSLP